MYTSYLNPLRSPRRAHLAPPLHQPHHTAAVPLSNGYNYASHSGEWVQINRTEVLYA